jgi:hypothetical protein
VNLNNYFRIALFWGLGVLLILVKSIIPLFIARFFSYDFYLNYEIHPNSNYKLVGLFIDGLGISTSLIIFFLGFKKLYKMLKETDSENQA